MSRTPGERLSSAGDAASVPTRRDSAPPGVTVPSPLLRKMRTGPVNGRHKRIRIRALGTGSLGPEIPCFLGTVRASRRPHSAGVGVAEHDGEIYFTSGPETRKSRNLAKNPACTPSLPLEGIDLIFEGNAQRVVDPLDAGPGGGRLSCRWLPRRGRRRRHHGPLQRAERRAGAVEPLPPHRPDRGRRRTARAARREPLAILRPALQARRGARHCCEARPELPAPGAAGPKRLRARNGGAEAAAA